jgi:hypothetical protein
MDIPMLEEHEWKEVSASLANAIQQIKDYRTEHNVSLAEAREFGYGRTALDRYFEITGFRETNADALWHHRVSLFGPPCTACKTLLRTPFANYCAECGAAQRSDN